MLKQLEKIQTGDEMLERGQTKLKEFAEQISNKEILDGLLYTKGNDGRILTHKLGRVPLGYIVVGQSVHGSVVGSSFSDKSITFTSSATMNVKLWIF
jgi:hypothetical protein